MLGCRENHEFHLIRFPIDFHLTFSSTAYIPPHRSRCHVAPATSRNEKIKYKIELRIRNFFYCADETRHNLVSWKKAASYESNEKFMIINLSNLSSESLCNVLCANFEFHSNSSPRSAHTLFCSSLSEGEVRVVHSKLVFFVVIVIVVLSLEGCSISVVGESSNAIRLFADFQFFTPQYPTFRRHDKTRLGHGKTHHCLRNVLVSFNLFNLISQHLLQVFPSCATSFCVSKENEDDFGSLLPRLHSPVKRGEWE